MAPRRAVTAALTLALLAFPLAGSARTEASQPEKAPAADKPGETKAGKKLEWLAFDVAADKAARQNKHLIVDVYTTWCGWCRVMERETYGNPEVANYLTDNFVLAKVNGESPNKLHWRGEELSERQFARKVGVTGYPATYFMKPDAEMLGGVPGFIRPPDFMVYSRYVATRWYQKGGIKDYVDSLRTAAQ
jgi:thioredoxin-related protein